MRSCSASRVYTLYSEASKGACRSWNSEITVQVTWRIGALRNYELPHGYGIGIGWTWASRSTGPLASCTCIAIASLGGRGRAIARSYNPWPWQCNGWGWFTVPLIGRRKSHVYQRTCELELPRTASSFTPR